MYLDKKVAEVLIPSLATCGGNAGGMYEAAKAIKGAREGELESFMTSPLATLSLGRLAEEAKRNSLTTESVLFRYGHPKHFQEMNLEAKRGMLSVAEEIPAEIRAVAHTLLPLRPDGTYSNEGRIISFKGLVPLGPQEGILVAHLAGVFSCRCSKQAVEKLLHAQALDPEFMAMADKVKLLDYEGTRLQRATQAAKAELGL